MRTYVTIGLSMLVGAVLGGGVMQSLHAQAKLKAYTIAEQEPVSNEGRDAYLTKVRKAIQEAHGRALRTTGGKVVHIDGAPAPKAVAIVEWDGVDDAIAFYKSQAWTDLTPERDKIIRTVRRYVVEVER